MATYCMRDSDLKTRLHGSDAAPTFAPRQTGRETWLDSCCEDMSFGAFFGSSSLLRNAWQGFLA